MLFIKFIKNIISMLNLIQNLMNELNSSVESKNENTYIINILIKFETKMNSLYIVLNSDDQCEIYSNGLLFNIYLKKMRKKNNYVCVLELFNQYEMSVNSMLFLNYLPTHNSVGKNIALMLNDLNKVKGIKCKKYKICHMRVI